MSKKQTPTVGAGIVVLIAALANLAWISFLLMIALGVVHSVWHNVPALGFWISVVIVMGVRVVASFLRSIVK